MAPVSKKQKLESEDSDRLLLAQAVEKLNSHLDLLDPLVQEIKAFDSKKLTSMDLEISAKKTEYLDLNTSLENDFKDAQIKIKHKLDEFKLVHCETLLKEAGLKSIDIEYYKTLTESLKDYESKFASKVEEITKELKSKHEAEKKAIEKCADLAKKAEHAVLEATVAQQKEEINVLHKVNEQHIKEIQEQRNLTKEVAMASAKGSINQTIGKQ